MRLGRAEAIWRTVKEKLRSDLRLDEKLEGLDDKIRQEHRRVTAVIETAATHKHPISDVNNLPARLAAIEARLTALEP